MPSGSRRPSLTMIFTSEPSGFAENTSPLLALRKNKRAVVVFAVVFLTSNLEDLTAITSSLLYLLLQFWQDRLNRKLEFTSIPLDKGAEAGYGFANNQVLHLECAFVGIKSFRIREEAADIVV